VADVKVSAGQTLEYEHVTSPRASARLVGRVWVDGGPPGPSRVVVRTATPQLAITSCETTLDPDGRFELALEPGLSTTIAVLAIMGDATLAVEAHPTIVAGPNEWTIDFETASLAGTLAPGTPAAKPFVSGPTYEAQRGDARIQVSFKPDEDGTFGPLTVPAGPGVLRGPAPDHRAPGPVWAELDLSAGETRRVELAPR
jgi:hypothetical protein